MPEKEKEKIKSFLYTNCLHELKGIIVGKQVMLDVITKYICKTYNYENITYLETCDVDQYLLISDNDDYYHRNLRQPPKKCDQINIGKLCDELKLFEMCARIQTI